MTVAHNDSHTNSQASVHPVKVERPYAGVPASQLADTLETQYGLEPLNEDIVFELLVRALEAEGAVEPSEYVDKL